MHPALRGGPPRRVRALLPPLLPEGPRGCINHEETAVNRHLRLPGGEGLLRGQAGERGDGQAGDGVQEQSYPVAGQAAQEGQEVTPIFLVPFHTLPEEGAICMALGMEGFVHHSLLYNINGDWHADTAEDLSEEDAGHAGEDRRGQ